MSTVANRSYSARRQVLANTVALLLFIALMVLLIWHLWPTASGQLDPDAVPRAITPRGDLGNDEKATIQLFKQTAPSVVHITNIGVTRDFFSFDVMKIPRGTGSGIIWDDQGHIITNYHVVKDAEALKVTLADHSTWEATRVQVDPDRDLAVVWIKAPKSKLKPILVGKSADLQVGQKAFAIGNPFGLDQTLTQGLVSALGREIEADTGKTIKGVIQTDAAINPGNSGGPLLDSAGRLIGVNTAIVSPSGSSAGIGFAIPVDEVNRVVTQLIKHGKVIHPGLGIQEVPNQLSKRWGIPGVLILNVNPDGPAAKAGLKATRRDRNGRIILGDAITAIDGEETDSSNQLFSLLDKHAVGDQVTVTVWHDGETRDVQMKLIAQ
jgi:S1-C subfamily serine protease